MSLSMYRASVSPLRQLMLSLSNILDKAAAHCVERKIDPTVLIKARLYPDMHPLDYQVRTAADAARRLMARLAGLEFIEMPMTETSFEQLKARVTASIDYIDGFKPEQINGSEDREILIPLPTRTLKFDGEQYLVNFVLPNFYFHVMAAYSILRHSGVDIGKADYIGPI